MPSDVIPLQRPEERPDAERIEIRLRDGGVAGLRYANPKAPRLLFCHANGFCASAYRSMFAELAANFDITAIDLRGHGRTTLPADPANHVAWDMFAKDIVDVLDTLNAEDEGDRLWTLAGHSLGGASSVVAAAGRRDVHRVVVIEPVIVPRFGSMMARTTLWRRLIMKKTPLYRGALARRSIWRNRSEVVDSYAGKPLFKRWAPGVLEDYLLDGLVETETDVRLACAPRWEAATFSSYYKDFWGALRQLEAPLSILAASHRSSTVFHAARPSLERAGASIERAPDVTHLAPFEAPQMCARYIADTARR